MRNFARKQLRGLTRLWERQRSQGWRPRNLIVLLIIGGTTLGVSITAAISYQVVRELVIDNLEQNALLKVQKESDEIDKWLITRKAEVETIASSPIVRSGKWSTAEPYLKLEAERLKNYFFLLLMVDANGNARTTKGGFSNVKDRKHFQKAMGGQLNVSDPLKGRTTATPQVAIAAPIWSRSPSNRRPIGELAGVVTIKRLKNVVNRLEYGSGSYAFALNSKGVPIVHPNLSVMGNLDKPAPSFLEALDPNLAAIARQMVNRRSAIELVRIDGKWNYVAYVPLEQAEWSIALVIPRLNLETQLEALNLLAIVVGIMLTLATLAALWQAQSFEFTRAKAAKEALLNRLTRGIRASLDLDIILQTTVEEIGTLLHLERAAFGWYDPQDFSLDIRWEYRKKGKLSQIGQFFGSPSLEAQLQHGEAIVLESALHATSNLEKAPETAPLQLKAYNYLALSIHIQDVSEGYLICTHTRHWLWTQEEMELLQAVADQLAIAITQSQLYTQTKEQVKLLNRALKELKTTQTHLVQSEKMSSLGQMVAGIAHEINNPVNFIYGNLPHAGQYVEDLLQLVNLYKQALPNSTPDIDIFETEIELDYIEEDLPRILTSMRMGADRIRQIVLSLRNFSRLDEADKKQVDIHEGIDSTLLLLQNRLKDKIQVVKHYGNLPLVECYPGQINQVFMNLLSNAIDALEEVTIDEKESSNYQVPAIAIRTEVADNSNQAVRIRIADNGFGIPPEIQTKIFDPFFTTKPVGKGTGLGLAISYQIVVDVHGGQINVRTPPTGGTEFVVEIPIESATRVGDRSENL